MNLTYPIIASRITKKYLEVGTGVLFIGQALGATIFLNLAGYLIKTYTQESSIKAILFCGWVGIICTGLAMVGAMFSRKPFKGYQKTEKD